MIASISINKYIYKILKEDTDLAEIVSNRIYPMIANIDKVVYPFVVFSRVNLLPLYTKDYNTEDIVNISVICCSNDYSNSIDTAEAVRKAMYKLHKYRDDNITINYCKLESVYENYESDCFLQQLDFLISIC